MMMYLAHPPPSRVSHKKDISSFLEPTCAFFITFAVGKRDSMQRNMTKRKTEQLMIFAASCVESAARASNVSSSEMYRRMKRVGLIEGFIIKCYEGLHTQSRQHVTEDVLGALAIWEAKKGVYA